MKRGKMLMWLAVKPTQQPELNMLDMIAIETAYNAIADDYRAVVEYLPVVGQLADDVLGLQGAALGLAMRNGVVSEEEIAGFDASVKRAPSPRKAVAAREAVAAIKALRAPQHASIKSDRTRDAAAWALKAFESYCD